MFIKVAVRYQSRGGNTKEIAEAIAQAAGVTAESIDVPLHEPVDVLFVGGGVYAHTIDPELKEYLETMPCDLVKFIAAFTTGAGMNATDKIAAIAREKGIQVCGKGLSIKKGLHNYRVFGGKGDASPSKKQYQMVNDFVKEVIGCE